LTTQKNKEQFLKNNSLFQDLTQEQTSQIVALMEVVQVEKGQYIVKEGDRSEELFLLQQGSAEVTKQDPESGHWHILGLLQAGDSIGEIALLDNEPRSASVRAVEDCVLYVLKIEDLESLSEMPSLPADVVKINLANVISHRLRHTNEITVKSLEGQLEEEKARFAMGTIVCWLLGGICVYVFALQVVSSLSKMAATTTMVSVPILIFFAVLTFFSIKESGYPFSRFGITTAGWKTSVSEAILFSIPVMGLIVLGKWLFIKFGTDLENVPLFYLGYSKQGISTLILTSLAYAVFSPIQEFIARGGIQSAFQELLISKHKSLIAIVLANLMFSMTHLHISTVIAIVVFVPGLFWGWLYHRHKTLIGVCVSHIIVGLFAIRVVGFPDLSS
jgi:CRP-like cAMP-binding protein